MTEFAFRKPETQGDKGVSVHTLITDDQLSIMQKVGPQFDVKIELLKKEG